MACGQCCSVGNTLYRGWFTLEICIYILMQKEDVKAVQLVWGIESTSFLKKI